MCFLFIALPWIPASARGFSNRMQTLGSLDAGTINIDSGFTPEANRFGGAAAKANRQTQTETNTNTNRDKNKQIDSGSGEVGRRRPTGIFSLAACLFLFYSHPMMCDRIRPVRMLRMNIRLQISGKSPKDLGIPPLNIDSA